MEPDTNFLDMTDVEIGPGRISVFFLCTCGGDVVADYDLKGRRYTLWHRRPEEEEANENMPMKFMNLDHAFRQGMSGVAWFVSQVHDGKLPKGIKRHRG